jgi:hypothetical protein
MHYKFTKSIPAGFFPASFYATIITVLEHVTTDAVLSSQVPEAGFHCKYNVEVMEF